MPLKDPRISRSPKAAIEKFVTDAGAVWAHATRVVLHRKQKPKEVAFEAEIVLLKNDDQTVVDESRSAVATMLAEAEANVERNGVGHFNFELIGIQELAIKGRKKVTDQPHIVLASSGWVVIGGEDDEEDAAAGGDIRGIVREVGKMVGVVSGAVQNIAQASTVATGGMESVIGVQTRVIEAQAVAFTAAAAAENRHAEGTLALATIKIDFEKWKFEQERAEQQRQEERAEQAAARERQESMIKQTLDAVVGLGHVIVADRKAEREAKYGNPPNAANESPPPPPPPSSALPKALAAAIAHLTPEQHEQLVEIFGRTTPRDPINPRTNSVWEIIVGASKQPSDQAALHTLANIGTDLAKQVTAAARRSVAEEFLTAEQAQTILDAYQKIGR